MQNGGGNPALSSIRNITILAETSILSILIAVRPVDIRLASLLDILYH